jgi:hypothetical protein
MTPIRLLKRHSSRSEIPVNQPFDFPHDYQVCLLDELPTDNKERRYYFPGANQDGGKDGLLARITPSQSADPWLGVFEFGDQSEQLVSGCWSHPDPFTVCVVARGRGYFVNAGFPTSWTEVISFPVTSVIPVVDEGLLLFADFTEVSAYSNEGLAWRTRQLSWDGLKITAIEAGRIIGLGHDPTLPTAVEFAVDLKSGFATGGSNPDVYIRRR